MERTDLENRFTYHCPIKDQAEKFVIIRADALHLAKQINLLCPDSREKSLAITKLEEVIMWANASIVRNEKD